MRRSIRVSSGRCARAATCYREDQARTIIRAVRVQLVDDDESSTTPATVRAFTEADAGYQPRARVHRDADVVAQMRRTLREDLEQLIAKHGAWRDLAAPLQRVLDELEEWPVPIEPALS